MSLTILIAEDEADVRDLIVSFLESRGHHLLVAANGAAALEMARAFDGAIDVLLTDVVMPVMSGVDLARHLQRERPDMDIVFMSGYAPKLAELRAGGCSSSAFLAKPFSLKALDDVLGTPSRA